MNAPEAHFSYKVRRWLADDYSRIFRWFRAAKGIFYNRAPRNFRPLHILHWTTKNALASSAPIIAFYYGSIGYNTAWYAVAGLFTANVAVGFLGYLISDRSVGDAEAVVRFGDLLGYIKSNSVQKGKRDDAIRSCFGILENHSRTITKSKKTELAVSLVRYLGHSTTQMIIDHRNPGNDRPVGRQFDGSGLLGHHACRNGGLPRAVHNTRHFGPLASPTQSGANYRSLLFIPIEVATSDGELRVKGFVSIDCKRPYAFYGNRSREIIVTCQPVIDHLKDLLRENG